MAQPPHEVDLSAALAAIFEDADRAGDEPQCSYAFGGLVLQVEEPDRAGNPSRFVRAASVRFQEPVAAVVPPEILPPFTRLRPDLPRLRHVAVQVGFMLEEPSPGHSYVSVRLVVRLDTPGVAVRALQPVWSTVSSASENTMTTEFSSGVAGPVHVGLTRTRAGSTRSESVQRPVVAGEDRGQDGFGWKYQAQEGAPLLAPRCEAPRALLELPRQVRELRGTLDFEAFTRVKRCGKFEAVRATPEQPPVPFTLDLGDAPGPPG
jgi:hypothetical protein